MIKYLVYLAFILLSLEAHSQEHSPPNIIVILIDDLGVMDTDLLDDAFYETPNIRKLAERGMTFTNGYCAHPRCVPSRYAIQTGRFPCRDRMNAGSPEKLLQKKRTIGQAFLDNGYATFFTGKWHLGKEEQGWPHHLGYEVNIGGCHAGAPTSYFFPFHVDRKNSDKEGKYGPMYGLESGEKDEHITERLTIETEKWIRSRTTAEDGKPFFAFLSHYAVHTPIEGKPDEVAHYDKKANSLPVPERPYQLIDGQTKVRRDVSAYASMIKTMDESVGKVIELLDELKIADNTVIAFTSDHGGLSNRGTESKRGVATSNLPYRAGKGHLYEGGLRVPFIFAYPKLVKAGSKTDTIAIGTDLYPTLLDLAGKELEPKDHADGISLVESLKGNSQTREKPFIMHSPLPRPDQTGDKAASAIRVKNLKLVKNYFPESVELYDLDTDPYEKNNIAASQPEAVEKLKGRLERTLVRYNSMAPRKHWKDKTVTAPLVKE